MQQRHATAAMAALALLVGATDALGQRELPPRIWDVPLGTHVGDLPTAEFVDPACGTNGGPPGAFIGSFENFAQCPADASGLHEVWFIYDDELEYVARAIAPSTWDVDPTAPTSIVEDRLVQRYRATQVMMHPVILSYLVDDEGRVQGYRIFTDPRSEPDLRMGAHTVAISFKGRFGLDGWECTNLALGQGEGPIGSPPSERFVKEHCELARDDMHITVESRLYRKPGQMAVDPFTGQATENEFESSSSIQVLSAAAAGD